MDNNYIKAKAEELSQFKHDVIGLRTKIIFEIEELGNIGKKVSRTKRHFGVFLKIVERLEQELLDAVEGGSNAENHR